MKTISDNYGVISMAITEQEETRRGESIVAGLGLKPSKSVDGSGMRYNPPRYDTGWGTKTALGLYRTIERIVLDGDI